MKDSGISWVGEIPKEWQTLKSKFIFKQRNTRGNNICIRLLSPTQKYGVIPQDNYEELTGMNAVKLNNNTNYALLKTIHKGDYCISLRSFQGGFEYSEYEGVVSPAYQVFYPIITIADGYYKYLFKERGFIDIMNSYTMSLRDGKNIAFDDFGDTFIPVPPFAEQQRIAEFLDRECGKIDGLKADIQSQIDTLEQYKRSVITEAVTHGLNPSAPMKDSGIPWVGNIPKHWNCCSLKYNYNTISGATPNSNDISLWDGEIVWVTPADYKTKDVYVCSGARKITHKGYLSCSTTLIKQGNIIFSKRAPIGSVAINKVELCTSQGCLSVVSKTGNVNNKYFYYLFSVNDETFNLFGSGTTFQEISAKDFLNVKFPLPPLDEQQEIADYLDNKCAKIEQIIADKKSQIETLDGYKKSLIYEYVTGKKEVV